MKDIVISAEGLGKKYVIGHQAERGRYVALRDVLAQSARGIWRKTSDLFRGKPIVEGDTLEEVWALEDVSFELRRGETLGIIGRNGAGKSTLLKVLSRITEPSVGRVTIRGRVASLLEVGTGFHPELTGRQNIFLNGAILGMGRSEIRRKFDEIVAFAEVERFLDTPVKHYSSGMYVRLAFAVAAHLEPEILVVDEVLAVGDAPFQKKCLGKMEEVGKGGRTVLFVSHNMNAVEQLCTRAILLERGRIKQHGSDVRGVIRDYLFARREETNATRWDNPGAAFANPWFKPLSFRLTDASGNALPVGVGNNSDIWVEVAGEVSCYDPALQVGYAVYNEDGTPVYWTCQTDEADGARPILSEGSCTLKSRVPKRLLNEGVYRIELILALYYRAWLCEPGNNSPAIYLTIQGGLSDSPYWMIRRPGIVAPVLPWTAAEPRSPSLVDNERVP